MVGDTE